VILEAVQATMAVAVASAERGRDERILSHELAASSRAMVASFPARETTVILARPFCR